MKKSNPRKQLNYRFHNPNTEEETRQLLTKIFTQVGVRILTEAIQKADSDTTELHNIKCSPVS